MEEVERKLSETQRGELEIRLIEFITQRKKKIDADEINKYLASNDEDGIFINNILKKLEEAGILYRDSHNCYTTFPKELVYGRVRIDKKGNYFVSQNNICTYIDSKYLNGALVNDLVILKKFDYRIQSREYGAVTRILTRANEKLVFEYSYGEGKYYFKPIGFDFNYDIKFNMESKFDLVIGTRVSASISNEAKNGCFVATINDVIGHRNDPDYYIKMSAICNGFDISFSKEALKELDAIPNYVTEDETKNRVDLRDKLIFTIDGANTKDMDDAISLSINELGNYVLGVHIADVAHYVKPDSKLYLEAYNRGTSLYLADSVIPMLPHKLSNGICSLNEGVDRLTKTCMIEIDQNGKIVKYAIFDSVINSKKKMTYDDVNNILEGTPVKGYNEFVSTLLKMNELSKKLSEVKNKRGYISFNDDDVIFETDDVGNTIDIIGRSRGPAEEMIENFMLLANEMVASNYTTLPFVYRVHPAPSEYAISEIIEYIRQYNASFRVPSNITTSKSIQGILNKAMKLDESELIIDIILRAMKKASYSCDNIGHFGLALSNYTHFTSPIRRFPDLMVHNLINKYNTDFDVEKLDELYDYLSVACEHSSLKEKKAAETEREVCRYKMVEFMEKNIGKEFDAFIYYVGGSHITAKLVNKVTGKISINDIPGNPYYEPSTNSIIADDRVYKVGSKIKVIVKSADKDQGTITFNIEKQKVKTKK